MEEQPNAPQGTNQPFQPPAPGTDGPHSYVTEAPAEMPGENYNPKLRVQLANEMDIVHTTRPVNPAPTTISEENQQRHLDSRQRYPLLNLTEGEYVILDIKRHPIGLFIPIGVTALAILAMTVLLVFYPSSGQLAGGISLPSYGSMLLPVLLLMLLIGIGGAIAVWIYLQNLFYLTNESVIQRIQSSLFSVNEQTVSLGSIEDASYKQRGILQMLFNYGTIRLSTEGDETTYRFSYVSKPREQVGILNNAIESFKNGRPVHI